MILLLVVSGGSGYVVRAVLPDAGGLVTGAQVRIADRTIGTVTDIGLDDQSHAVITMSLDSGEADPLHAGTQASIRAVGAAGVTNHYVELSPGPAAATAIPNGGEIPIEQTHSIVSLDEVLDAIDPQARASIQSLIAHASDIYSGSGAMYFNRLLGELSPAFVQVSGLSSELASDRADLRSLIIKADAAATAIAARRQDLRDAVANTAVALNTVAGRQIALADGIRRAPDLLRTARSTLNDAANAVDALRPALRDVPPAAAPLDRVARRLVPALDPLTPALASLRSEMPSLQTTIRRFVPLSRTALPALTSTASALNLAEPILVGVREYGPDLLLGILNGLVGISTAPYDFGGHYVHLEFTQSPQQLISGALSKLLSGVTLAPSLFGLQTHILARCPGSNEPPAPDGSNPWMPTPSLCNPAENMSPLVNQP